MTDSLPTEPPPSVTHYATVSKFGLLAITIQQISQNWAANTSRVQVTGTLINNASGRVTSNSGVSRNIHGDDTFTDSNFSFSLASGEHFDFINHTFTVTHGPLGYKTVNFTVHYGTTGTTVFDDNQSSAVSLDLWRIPLAPTVPGFPVPSSITPTTCQLTWTAPSDNGGSTIITYEINQVNEDTLESINFFTGDNGVKYLVENLDPNTDYIFFIRAQNASAQNDGYSPFTLGGVPMTTPGGGAVRSSGHWKQAAPYVRVGGVWKTVVPYIRSGGTWKQIG